MNKKNVFFAETCPKSFGLYANFCRILTSSLRQNVSIKLTDCALVVKAIFVIYVIFVTFSICYEKTANYGAVAPCLFPQHTDVYH